jgi:hypothetical protein
MPITTDPERLQKVAAKLGMAIAEAERTGQRVRLPVVQPSDAAGLTMVMHEALDDAIADREATVAAEGLTIACSAGCSSCCVSPVLVTEGEAVTVAEWLLLPENASVRARFLRAYRGWRAGVAHVLEPLTSARSNEEVREAAAAYKAAAVMCAFNHEGLCSVYPARPSRCRRAHALTTNEHCGAGATGEVQYYEHGRTEMTFHEQEPLRAALHHALRPNAGLDALCAAVYRLLDAKTHRNGPCPCGSGEKYKRCCAS